MFERQSGRTVHTRSTLSATRKDERAAKKAVEIAEQKKTRAEAKGKPQPRAPKPAKEPSPRPYRAPEPVAKAKRVVRTVSERDGQNLLRRIEARGGREIIVMMRDSGRTPQEIAEGLMVDETIVITSLDAYGTGKDRLKRLLAAIEQAPHYLKNDDGRPVVTGVRKQKRQDEAQAKQGEIASRRKNPRTRVLVAPTLAEVSPQREDRQIVFEELKEYLGLNASLGHRVISASSDHKAARILMFNVGPRFDAKVKALLAAPSEYQDLLAEAGATIRRDARKYDTSDTAPTGPTPSVQESSELAARRQSQQDALDNYTKTVDARGKEAQLDADDPEAEAKRELWNRQEDSLRKHLETRDEHS
jgi:hypothetical protein